MTITPPWRNPDQISSAVARDIAQIGRRHDQAKLTAIHALLKALPPQPAHGRSKSPEATVIAGIRMILEEDA